MADAPSYPKLVPGFDFLQDLVKNAGSALPHIGQWVAPTLNPDELEKRIEELRTVQFWLEQNARMLGATIQAMEVQRMTLSTLKTMNVRMEDLRDSMRFRAPTDKAPDSTDAAQQSPSQKKAASGSAQPEAAPLVDPMQWWGALTKQFTQLAAAAIKDSTADAAKHLAAAADKKPAAPPSAPQAADMPAKTAGKTTRKRPASPR
jgi:hypothetical protein